MADGRRELGLPLPSDYMRCSKMEPHMAHWHRIVKRLSQNTATPDETEDKWCDGQKPKKRKTRILGEYEDDVT
jgi:hypothetical protein